MTTKTFSTFVDERFYYDFVGLYNSWLYYEHKTPLKVYISGYLSPDKKEAIAKHCEIIEDPEVLDPENKKKYKFKFIALINNMSDQEIFLDTDTIFLSNIDYLFDYLDRGKLIVADESNANFTHENHKYAEGWPAAYDRIKSELVKYIGDHANNYTSDFFTVNYNVGLLGVRKDMHKFYLKKVIEILNSDFDTLPNPTSQFEQYMLSFLIKLYNINKEVLPQNAWMNTWHLHNDPKKLITVDDGKFAVYDALGTKINFYHFTGGFYARDENNEIIHAVKPHMLFDQPWQERKFTRNQIEDGYYKFNNNPLLLLFEYFCNKGLN
jgi:hypothetical protein